MDAYRRSEGKRGMLIKKTIPTKTAGLVRPNPTAAWWSPRRANHEDVGNAHAIKASDSNRIARSVSVFELPLSMAR
jgi:hypothetical protein